MIDIERILDTYNVHHSPVRKGWVNTQCPHCADHGDHGGFYVQGPAFNCWKCGKHDVGYTLKLILGVNYSTLNDIINSNQTRMLVFDSLNQKKVRSQKVKLVGGPLEKQHKKYLIDRNFDPYFLERKYKLLGTSFSGEWSNRIIIPIIYRGEVVSFQGRTIVNSKARYKTLEKELSILSGKEVLYNLDNAEGERVVICEGPFDVMRMGNGVIGTLGTEMTPIQIEMIYSRYKSAVFLFDPEYNAQKRAEKQGNMLSSLGIDVDIADLELTVDPGDLTEDEVEDVRRELAI